MPIRARMTRAASGVSVGEFSVLDLPNLEMWLKSDTEVFSDAGITPATNGDGVEQWNDQSGNGNNLSVNGAEATYTTGQINSLPALDANSSNIVRYSFTSNITTTAFTMFFVMEPTSTSWGRVISGNVGTQNARIRGSNYNNMLIRSDDSAEETITGIGFLASTWYYVTVTFDGADVTAYVNGVSKGSVDRAGETFTWNMLLNEDGGSGALNGMIAEVIICSSLLSGTNISNTESYLSTRYAL